jgi:hypothetical protein
MNDFEHAGGRRVVIRGLVKRAGGVRPGAVATFRPFQAGSAAEKVAMMIDSIELCTACHAEGRGFEPRRSRQISMS